MEKLGSLSSARKCLTFADSTLEMDKKVDVKIDDKEAAALRNLEPSLSKDEDLANHIKDSEIVDTH